MTTDTELNQEPIKVFILDNNIISLMVIDELLATRGYTVVKMSTVSGFLAKVEYEMPDLLIIDVTTPRLDVDATMMALKKSDKLQHMACIIHSDFEPQEAHDFARQYDLDGYYCKSQEVSKMPDYIEQLFAIGRNDEL